MMSSETTTLTAAETSPSITLACTRSHKCFEPVSGVEDCGRANERSAMYSNTQVIGTCPKDMILTKATSIRNGFGETKSKQSKIKHVDQILWLSRLKMQGYSLPVTGPF